MPPTDTTASFGYWIRRQRLALDLTQAALARRVGCATVTISKLEQDQRRPSRQMAELLADNLAITDDERERFLATALGDQSPDRMPLAAEPLESSPDGSDSRPFTNLPVPPTPFVGRSHELAHLAQRLADPACRLLTLVGLGGFGKTRLAMRLGEISLEMEDLFGDGVFLVAMDGLESANLVVPAIAAALQFTFYEQQEQSSQLLNHLANKRLLLILDNADQLLTGGLVEEVLTRAPQVKILATSREALNLQQEWFYPIDGLAVMDKESEAGDEDKAGVADAVRLFQQSARRANPDFDLDRERVHVQRICRLVDGAPLGIELAAAWLKALSCEQIARELEQSLDFLSTSLRNIPDRHRSMRVVLEQTWHYLSAEEQRVFRRLSIFAGGFRADAAQAVAEASLRMLASLVEKSVLHLAQDGRYRIHSLLRQLAAEKLAGDPSELAAAQARHSTVYMAFLRDRQLSIAGPDQKRVLVEVEEEMDNIRVAWSHATRHQRLDDLVTALACALPLSLDTWSLRGRRTSDCPGAWIDWTVLALTDEQWPAQIALTARRAQFAAARGAHQAGACHAGPGTGRSSPCRQPARTSALPLRDRRDRRLSGRNGRCAGQPERRALTLSSIGAMPRAQPKRRLCWAIRISIWRATMGGASDWSRRV